MSFYELILSRRSIRQFKPEPVSKEILEKLVNAARLAPTASNLQPLEFIVVDKDELRKDLFPCLKWARYIVPEGNPKQGHEPVAYIIVLVNLEVRGEGYEWDVGAAAENMILTALEEGIGSCWLHSIERKNIKEIFKIPENYKIDSVIALGYPDETPMVEELDKSLEYWKDKQECLHVPKRKLEDIVHFNIF